MTPTNKRNLMLATSGLAGLAGLASLTLGVNEANAACVLTSGVLVCDSSSATSDQSTEINTAIAAQPAGAISVQVTGGGTVDLDAPAIKVNAPQFDAAVTFENATTLGKADGTDAKFALASVSAVTITGDDTKATNTVAFTNNGRINGSVVIGSGTRIGGTVTAIINKDIIGTAAKTGGTLTINSIGDQTVTLVAGATINGGITLNSDPGTTTKVDTVVGTKTTKVFTPIGGGATVLISGTVGTLTTAVPAIDPVSGLKNADVFTPGAVTVQTLGNAKVTLDATAKVGAVTVNPGRNAKTVVDDSSVSGGITTVTNDTSLVANGATITYAQAAGAVQGGTPGTGSISGVAGNLSLLTFGGAVDFNNAGAAAQGANATGVAAQGLSKVDIDTSFGSKSTTSTSTSTSAALTVVANSSKTTASTTSAKVTFVNSGTIGTTTTPAPVNITGNGVDITVSGTQGNTTVIGGAVTAVTSSSNTFEDVTAAQLTAVTGASSTNIGKDINLTVASTGVVSTGSNVNKAAGDPTLLTGGAAINVTSAGRINGLTVNATSGANNTTGTGSTTKDKTGVITATATTGTQAGTGGDITLVISGNIAGSATPGGTFGLPNTLTAIGQNNITATLTGPIIGNTSLTTTTDDFNNASNTATPIGGPNSSSQVNTRSATGGNVAVTIGAASTVGAQNGTGLTVAADGTVTIQNDGRVRGNLTSTSARTVTTRDNNGVNASVTTKGEEVITQTITTLNTTNATAGGAAKVVNTALNPGGILGDATVTAGGAVTFDNPGFIAGNVTLASQGVTTTVDNNTTVNKDSTPTISGKTVAAEGETLITTSSTNNATVVTHTGGAVTSTFAGVVGLDNVTTALNTAGSGTVNLTAGTQITQTADTNSSAVLSGKIFESFVGAAGVNNTSDTTVASSTLTTTSDTTTFPTTPASVLLTTAKGTGTSTVTHTETANLGKSDVTVSGVVGNNLGGGKSSISSTAQGASTVSVSGSVSGNVSSASAATNVSQVTVSDTTTGYKAGVLNKSVPQVAAALTTKKVVTNSTTTVGGASLIDITGAGTTALPTIGGNVTSNGQTTSTVNVGAKSVVGGNVTAQVSGGDTAFSQTQTKSSSLFSLTDIQASVLNKVTATSGAATATINGAVGGSVTATALSGPALATINNTVAGNVTAQSNGVNSNTASSVTVSALGTLLTSSSTTVDTAGVGGAATVNLTGPAGLVPLKQSLVGGNVVAAGGTSGTVTVAANTQVAGNVTASAIQNVKNKDSTVQTIAPATITNVVNAGNITGSVRTVTATTTGGTGTVTNNGTVLGTSTAVGATANATNSATGVAGVIGGPSGGIGARALIEDSVQTVTVAGLNTVGLTQTTTDVTVFTPQTTTKATVVNNGAAVALFASGATGSVTNAATAYAWNGVLGGAVNNYTRTLTTNAVSTADTVVVNKTLFSQVYTLDQNGVMEGGIDVVGAYIPDPTSTLPFLKTSDVKATINLNSGSLTSGGIRGEWDGFTGLNPGSGTAATGAFLTTATVNLNGTGFLGHDGAQNIKTVNQLNIFAAAPTLTDAQVANHALNSQGVSFIDGITTVNHTGAGTFYIYGRDHTFNTTPSPLDNSYTWRVKNFNNTAGRVEFATPNYLIGGVFSINGDTTNSAEFVMGHTVLSGMARNPVITAGAASLLNTQTLIDGQEFLFTGNFTQAATGSLFVSGSTQLLRSLAVGGASATETLAFFPYTVGAGPFVTNSNPLVKSHATVEGNLNLAGKIVIGNQRGSLSAAGQVQELFTVTGTVTNTATVAPLFNSNFVTYAVTTGKSGANTTVNVTTGRTSFTSVAADDNSTAALAALDSGVAPTIQAINDDNTGKSVFSSLQRFREVQDFANTIAGFDWTLGQPDLAKAGQELAQGEFFGSLNGYDTTRQFVGAMSNSGADSDAPATIWVTPSYRTTTIDGDTKVGSGDIKVGEAGLFAGGAFRINDMWGFNLGAGYQSGDVDGEDKPVSADVTTYLAGADGWWRSGPIRIGGGLAYGVSNINTKRHMTIFGRDVTADYDSQSLVVNLDGSYDFENVLGGTVTPYLHVGIRNVSTDGFRENLDGGGLALVVDKVSDTETTPVIGVTWKGMDWNWGVGSVSPHAGLAVVFSDSSSTTTQRFVGGGDAFTLQGVDPSTYGELSAGFTGKLGDMGNFSVDGAALFGDVSGGSISATLRLMLGK